MKTNFILIVISFFLLISCNQKKDKTDIKLTFESYKRAVKLNNDSILFFIDSESKNKFIEFEQLVKQGNQNRIDYFINKQNAPLTWKYLFSSLENNGVKLYDIDTINLISTIGIFSLADIRIFKSEDINNFEFDNIVDKEMDTYNVNIIVKNHFISGSNKLDILVKFPFRKENDKWKFNVISYFNLFDKVIIYEAKYMGISPEEHIKNLTKKSELR